MNRCLKCGNDEFEETGSMMLIPDKYMVRWKCRQCGTLHTARYKLIEWKKTNMEMVNPEVIFMGDGYW